MNVICTQSETCKVLTLDINPSHRISTPEHDSALYRCIHRDPHNHTPLCEIKCCDQIGIVKCRKIEE